jgi:hypothetical protein
MMLRVLARGAGAILVGVLLGACVTPKEPFTHTSHRRNYSIEDQELKEIQFYLSTEVLAKDTSKGDTAEGVLIVPEEIPGVVTEVGPNWIRVSFEKGGSGVPFLAALDQKDDGYWLATEVEGQQGFHKVQELAEKILLVQGTRYKLVYGANAYLVFNRRDLDKLIERRRHLKGRAK